MNFVVSRAWLFAVALPFCLILPQVFVDLAHGFLGASGRSGLLSIGVVIRGLLAILAVIVLLRLRAPPLKSFLLLFATIFLVSNLVWASASEVYSLGHELSQATKIAYPWLIAGIFLYLHQQAEIDQFYLLTLLAWAGFLSAAALLGAAAIGIGQDTYGDWSYGVKGLFTAQNDIGLTLLLTLVAAIVILARTRKILYLVVATTIASGCLMLGTRTGVLGPPVVVVGFLLASLLNRRLFAPFAGRSSWGATAVLLVPLFVTIAVAVGIFSQSDKTNYLLNRIESLSEATPRSKTEAAGIKRLVERRAVFTLIGEGGLAFKKNVAANVGFEREKIDPGLGSIGSSKKLPYSVRRVENDVLDVMGFYGVAQLAVIYGALAIIYMLSLRKAIRSWEIENVAILMILTLFLGHSTLAGHGLFSAQVAIVLAPVLFLQIRDLRWRHAE